MNAKRHLIHLDLATRLGGVAFLTLLAAMIMTRALAQSPAGIAGVLAQGVVPELVQEGFVFTEGPVGTADGGLFFSEALKSLSACSAKDVWFARARLDYPPGRFR